MDHIEIEALRKLVGNYRELLGRARETMLTLSRCPCEDCRAEVAALIADVERVLGPEVSRAEEKIT